jgi:PhzF family phenazine biosynthesis protein
VTPAEGAYLARVFDLNEELVFAGHPVLGAAAVLHAVLGAGARHRWTIRLKGRTVSVDVEPCGDKRYSAALHQGPAAFVATPGAATRDAIASWFSLSASDLDARLAPAVVSSGLRYLVVPVRSDGLARAQVAVRDLDARLATLGAEFGYLLDAEGLEGRHWNNDGLTEDVATGSAAGCVAAYLRCHDRLADGEAAVLRQGRFVLRPSEITIQAYGAGAETRVVVGGSVCLVGQGRLDALPG